MKTKYKNIDYNTLTKNSYVISINPFRYIISYNLFKKILGFIPKKITGNTSTKNFKYNCNLSHLSIIKKAKDLNLPYVFIFEDDAYPCVDCTNKLKEYIKFIPNDAKLAIIGHIGFDVDSSFQAQPLEYKFNKNVSNVYGAHAYIVFNESYDYFIKLIEENIKIRPIDDIINNFKVSKDNIYIINKPLFIQCNYNNISNNNHTGYVYPDINAKYGWSNSKNPPDGFLPIEDPRMLGKKK